MLFNSLDKFKRSMVMMIVFLMFTGLTLFVVPMSFVPMLGKFLGFCFLVLAILRIIEFTSSNKALIHYIRLSIGLVLGLAGILLFAIFLNRGKIFPVIRDLIKNKPRKQEE